MNTLKTFVGIGIVLMLSACGEGTETEGSVGSTTGTNNAGNNTGNNNSNNTNGGTSSNTNNQNNNTNPTTPVNAGNGTFPNGIWEATGSRDALFVDPPILGEAYAGGMIITNTTLDIYEALSTDGASNGIAPCYRPTVGIEWSTWPTAIGGFDGVDFAFEGSYESGMQRTVIVNDEAQEKLYYTYVGPVTADSATAFHAKYATACQ